MVDESWSTWPESRFRTEMVRQVWNLDRYIHRLNMATYLLFGWSIAAWQKGLTEAFYHWLFFNKNWWISVLKWKWIGKIVLKWKEHNFYSDPVVLRSPVLPRALLGLPPRCWSLDSFTCRSKSTALTTLHSSNVTLNLQTIENTLMVFRS